MRRKALVRSSRRRGRPRRVVAQRWQRWVAENLLREVDPGELVQGLLDAGVPEALAQRTVAELAASPALALARGQRRSLARVELVTRLLQAVGGPTSTIERTEHPSAAAFFSRYWSTCTPAIFTDVISAWPVRWTPGDLHARFGAVEVEACIGREADPRPEVNWRRHRVRMTLAEYIDRCQAAGTTNDLYLIANNRNTARPRLRALWDDVVLPAGWFDESNLAHGSALWLGPAGTVTPLHHDTSNILFCQVFGRKRVFLAPPWAQVLLEASDGVYSSLTLAQARERGVAVVEVELQPGEALFIPVGWWHELEALDLSISLAINAFARSNTYHWYRPGRSCSL